MTDVYCLNVTRVAYMTLYTTSFGNNGVQAYITAFGCTCYPLRCVRLFLIRQLRRVSKQQANFGKHGLILIILGKQHQHTLSAYSTFLVPSLLLNLLVLSSYDGNDATPATWSSASLTHGTSQHYSSTKLLVNGKSGYVHAWRWKDITLNIC